MQSPRWKFYYFSAKNLLELFLDQTSERNSENVELPWCLVQNVVPTKSFCLTSLHLYHATQLNVTSAPTLLARGTRNPWKPTGWCKEYYAQPFVRWVTGYTNEVCRKHHEDTVLWQRRQLYGAHSMPVTGEGYGSSLWKQGSLDNGTGYKQQHSEYFALLPTGQRGPVV